MSKPANPLLRGRILALALEELGEKPPERINMRSLAKRAGVSATAIYYYFPSKDALFETIKFEAMAELDARVEAAIKAAASEGTAAKMKALIRAYAAWCLEKPQLSRLLMEALPAQEELDEESMGRYYATFFRAQALIEEAVAEGSLSPRDAALEASLGQAEIWGIVSQFRSKRVHPRFWASADALVERFMEIFPAK